MKVLTYPALSTCIMAIVQHYPDAKLNKKAKDILEQLKTVSTEEALRNDSIFSDIVTVNKFLKKVRAGFSLTGSSSDEGIAAVYESAVTFARKAKSSEIKTGGETYKAAFHESVSSVKVGEGEGFYIKCKEGRTLFICQDINKDVENFILTKPFRNLRNKARTSDIHLHVPCAKASLLENFSKTLVAKVGGDNVIEQAFCQTDFSLNTVGARAKQVAAIGLTKTARRSEPRVVKITKPFVAVILNSNGEVEFAAKLSKTDWEK